jgi:hypothetical protein
MAASDWAMDRQQPTSPPTHSAGGSSQFAGQWPWLLGSWEEEAIPRSPFPAAVYWEEEHKTFPFQNWAQQEEGKGKGIDSLIGELVEKGSKNRQRQPIIASIFDCWGQNF